MIHAFQAIVLGIVEGITEFLPISSTGHLILASKLMNLAETPFVKSFMIIIQLGSILAVVVLYWKKIWSNSDIWKKVIVAFIPTAVIGLILYKVVKTYLLGNVMITILALAIGGVVLVFFERWVKRPVPTEAGSAGLTYMQSFWVGVFQAIAIIPGVSRSAATIVGGQLIGVEKRAMIDFSFILAIPTMLAATGLDLIKNASSFSSDQFGMLSLGFIVSFIVALLAVRTFLSYIQKNSFAAFGIYRILVAILFLVLWWR